VLRPETSTSVPPNPHHRACDEAASTRRDDDELDISSYLDNNWSYPKDDDGNSEQHGCRGDQLQYRVEAHLANMFPSSSGLFSSRPAVDNEDAFVFRGGYSPNEEQNGDSSRDVHIDRNSDLPVSKAAEFFHPRPVNALLRYKNFFSPILTDAVDQSAEEKDNGDRVMLTSTAANHRRGLVREQQQQQQLDRHSYDGYDHHSKGNVQVLQDHVGGKKRDGFTGHPSSQYQKENLKANNTRDYRSSQHDFNEPSKQHHHNFSQHSKDDDNLKLTTNPAYAATTEDPSPSVKQNPCDLFQAKDNSTKTLSSAAKALTSAKASSFLNLYNSSKPSPAGQSTLTQNPNTGQLGLAFAGSYAADVSKSKIKTWNDYGNGGRAVVNACQAADETNDTKKQKQASKTKDATKKPKSNNSKNQRQSEVENLLDSMQHKASKKRPSDPADGANKADKRSKKNASNEIGEAQLPPTIGATAAVTMTNEDFEGLEHVKISNAAGTKEGLHSFLSLIGKQRYVTWTMLFLDKRYAPSRAAKSKKKKGSNVRKSGKFDLPQEHDGFKISSAFLPTSKKYCTEKGESD
jgi:hypothetical protein